MGLTNPPRKKLSVTKPEAVPAIRKEQMAWHSKGGQGLKRAVVPQKKKIFTDGAPSVAGKILVLLCFSRINRQINQMASLYHIQTGFMQQGY